jgi:hypothetical protein
MSRPVKIREARDRGNPVGVAVEWGLHNSRRNRELQGELDVMRAQLQSLFVAPSSQSQPSASQPQSEEEEEELQGHCVEQRGGACFACANQNVEWVVEYLFL